MREKSSSKKVIVEKDIIESFSNFNSKDYKVIESEKRKNQKAQFRNRLAAVFLFIYCMVLITFAILPMLGYCSVPTTLAVMEKIGTLLIAIMFGYYFYAQSKE